MAVSSAVYSGLTTMPSGVVQFKAATSPPGADLAAARKLVIAPVAQAYPLREGVEVLPPLAAVALLAAQ